MPYQVEMAPGFTPWQRNVHWQSAQEIPIRPLLSHLAFVGDGKSWGYKFRFGLFEIGDADAASIASRMLAGDAPQ